jgi:nucleoside 2-deoxyribosyltransferase
LFLENIKKSDLVLAYINYPDKSEGQLLELGMAYAL